jgi:hypothetical protein
MPVPTDELSLFIRDWYYAASEAQSEAFLSFFLDSPETVYLGSDPQGPPGIASANFWHFKTYGKWTIMSKNGWFIKHEMQHFSRIVEFSARLGGSAQQKMPACPECCSRKMAMENRAGVFFIWNPESTIASGIAYPPSYSARIQYGFRGMIGK